MFQMHLTIDENNSHQSEIHNFEAIVALSKTSFHLDTVGSSLTSFADIVNITFVFWNLLFVINNIRLVNYKTDFSVNRVVLNIYFEFVFTLQFVHKTSQTILKYREMSFWIWKHLSTWYVTKSRNTIIWPWNLGRFAFQESLSHRCFSRYVRAE
jgi:hypothetical protein